MTTTTRTEFDVGTNLLCVAIMALALATAALFLLRPRPERYEPPTRVSTPMHQVYPADPRPGPHNQ